jgi:YgiT-type zinc finger domain-containing protein
MECPHCKGELEPGRTTYTVNGRGYSLRFDEIPAWICRQCDEPAFDERVVEALQHLLVTLDESLEWIQSGEGHPRWLTVDSHIGEEKKSTPHEGIESGQAEGTITPEEAAKDLEAWAARHREALIGISVVEVVREARESY